MGLFCGYRRIWGGCGWEGRKWVRVRVGGVYGEGVIRIKGFRGFGWGWFIVGGRYF